MKIISYLLSKVSVYAILPNVRRIVRVAKRIRVSLTKLGNLDDNMDAFIFGGIIPENAGNFSSLD